MTAGNREYQVSGTSMARIPTAALKQVAPQQLRRSNCHPDFLKEYLTKGPQSNGTDNIELVTGNDATQMYKDYVKQIEQQQHHSPSLDDPKRSNSLSTANPNIVFAFPAKGRKTGSKVVDLWMTWRGRIPGTKTLKGSNRRRDFLDGDFKNIRRGLHNEYKRVSQFTESEELPTIPRVSANTATTPVTPAMPLSPRSTPPVDEDVALKPPPPIQVDGTTRPHFGPRSSVSVQSLPYLDLRSGVNRAALTLTNPDPSLLSASMSPAETAFPHLNLIPPSPKDALGPWQNEVPPPIAKASSTDSSQSSGSKLERKKSKTHKSSLGSLGSIRKGSSSKRDSKIVFVLLDEPQGKDDDKNISWHSLLPKASIPTGDGLVRKASTARRSAWNGQPVFVNGSTQPSAEQIHTSPSRQSSYRTPPRSRRTSFRDTTPPQMYTPMEDDISSSDSEYDLPYNEQPGPTVPGRTLPPSMGYAPSTPESMRAPHIYVHSPPMAPTQPLYQSFYSPHTPSGYSSLPALAQPSPYVNNGQPGFYPSQNSTPSAYTSSIFGTPPGFVPQSIQTTPLHTSVPIAPMAAHWQPLAPYY